MTYRSKVIYGSLLLFALAGLFNYITMTGYGGPDYLREVLFSWWLFAMAQMGCTLFVGVIVAIVQWGRGARPTEPTKNLEEKVLDHEGYTDRSSRSAPWFLAAALILLVGNSLCLGILS